MAVSKMLIVDDERDHCFFMEDYFKRRGYSVDVAYDGQEAARMIGDNEYGFVLFDCNMPEMSGMELISIIDEKNPKAKKIMISGYEGIDKTFAENIGVDIFMSKPFSYVLMLLQLFLCTFHTISFPIWSSMSCNVGMYPHSANCGI